MNAEADDSSGQLPAENAKDGVGPLDALDGLIWGFLDASLSPAETAKLESLLRDDQKARNRYVECVRLHSALAVHFAPRGGTSLPFPLLGNLPSDVSLTRGEAPLP